MPNYCTINTEGQIEQLAIGFVNPPFPGAIEVPDEVIDAPDEWMYQNGEFVRVPKAPEPPPQPTELELAQQEIEALKVENAQLNLSVIELWESLIPLLP